MPRVEQVGAHTPEGVGPEACFLGAVANAIANRRRSDRRVNGMGGRFCKADYREDLGDNADPSVMERRAVRTEIWHPIP